MTCAFTTTRRWPAAARGRARWCRCSWWTRRWPCRRTGPGSSPSRSRRCARSCAASAATWSSARATRSPRRSGLATGARAQAVFIAADVSRYAARRERRLAAECERHRMALAVTAGHQVVPAGELQPGGGGPLPGLHALLARLERRDLAAPARDARGGARPGRASTPAACPPRERARRGTSRPAGSGRPRSGPAPGWTGRSRATPSSMTRSPPTRRPGSAPTCGSAACRRSRWPGPRGRTQVARSSAASWPGATSSTRSRRRSRTSRPGTTGPGRAARRTGRGTRTRSTRGGPGRPASRSSTPGCGSSPPRGSCTTGPA